MAVTASYTLTGELLFDMARRAEENLFTGLAEETLDESGYFRPTSPAAQPRFSLIIDIRVQRNSRFLLAMFSTLTLNLFPYWSGDDLLFVAVLRDAERRVEGERRIKGRVGYMAWLPLLVAMPFVSSSRGATSDLYREVLTDVVAWSHDVIQGREQPRTSATVAQAPGSAHR